MAIRRGDQQEDVFHKDVESVGEQPSMGVVDLAAVDARAPSQREDAGSRPAIRPSWMAYARVPAAFAVLISAVVAAALVGQSGAGAFAQGLTLGVFLLATCYVVAADLPERSSDRPRRSVRRPTRIAVIGSQSTAVALDQELAINRISAYTSVGWIAFEPNASPIFPLPKRLGGMHELASLVERHQIHLLVIGSDVPRLAVFDELVRLTDYLSVRVCELSGFYESAFGHIPVADINSAWFQYVMHPKFRDTSNRPKRAFDIVVAACLGVLASPVLLLAAMAIKLDGGRALYRQRRIGEKGRPFTMYKLRTMRERETDDAQVWASVEDPRVTRVGRVLRRLHVDELPQLYNVLRGEMSIVGPRPEQPDIVSRLEAEIAFYSRRHLIKPGLAGWAQLRCGYARTERGSAWKLCHDLYYLKHQSLWFDVKILVRTFLTLAWQVAEHERHERLAVGEPRGAVATSGSESGASG
jgi:exopolysaccharide biosynthesis polyprenyl glycosylphosphotransferase